MVAAITFPVDLATFFDTLSMQSVSFSITEPQAQTRLADGTVLKAKIGAALWQGEVTLVGGEHADMAAIAAKLSVVERAGSSFFIYDPRKPGPAYDPDGSLLGASTPTILALNADNKRLSIQGLPTNYELTPGDFLSFTYGSSPTRYALHQVVSAAQADGLGQTDLFEVTPLIRPGASTSAAVTLIKPYCKAVLTDLSFGAGSFRVTTDLSFSFVQTLR